MSHKGNYEPDGWEKAVKAAREQIIIDSVTKTADAIVKGFKNHVTGKTRNKKTHLQPKKKKRK